jgi:hypothetical protein
MHANLLQDSDILSIQLVENEMISEISQKFSYKIPIESVVCRNNERG